MRISAKIAVAATVLLIGTAGSTMAMPAAPPSSVGINNANTGLVQEARLVCGPRGCFRVGPRRLYNFAPRRFGWRRGWRRRWR